jgi:small-conductance mechanosensitive channel
VVYGADLAAVYAALRAVAQQLRADPLFAPSIEEALEISGVERLDGAAVTVRCRLRVRPLEQWRVRREFLQQLKVEFERRGILLPAPPVLVGR